jgi:hypothetical protein
MPNGHKIDQRLPLEVPPKFIQFFGLKTNYLPTQPDGRHCWRTSRPPFVIIGGRQEKWGTNFDRRAISKCFNGPWGQGDQMRLRKCSPIHVMSNLMCNFYCRKSSPKMWAIFVIFLKAVLELTVAHWAKILPIWSPRWRTSDAEEVW